jgi:cyclic pyranopterin monophosphate synthase
MIDVSPKENTLRYARAEGRLLAPDDVLRRVREGDVPKGDVPATARAAGIAAAKRTSDWIVFCHPIPLDWVDVDVAVADDALVVTAEVRSKWKTGVEMEAITAVTGALLNAYDMLKPLDPTMTISDVRVVEKRGGKSDPDRAST